MRWPPSGCSTAWNSSPRHYVPRSMHSPRSPPTGSKSWHPWHERYGKRIEDTRLPREQVQRDAYAQTVGEDGFYLLDGLAAATVRKPTVRPRLCNYHALY